MAAEYEKYFLKHSQETEAIPLKIFGWRSKISFYLGEKLVKIRYFLKYWIRKD